MEYTTNTIAATLTAQLTTDTTVAKVRVPLSTTVLASSTLTDSYPLLFIAYPFTRLFLLSQVVVRGSYSETTGMPV